jgi:hypothetical protein
MPFCTDIHPVAVFVAYMKRFGPSPNVHAYAMV